MKFALAIVLAAFAIVPALADGGTNTSARARHRARLAAMTPEQRAARKAAAQKSKAAERAEQTRAITAKFAAAKAACGPDCYRVLCTNGVYVAFTKPQFEEYERQKAEESKREREAMEARKSRKHTPGKNLRSHSRKHMKRRMPGNG